MSPYYLGASLSRGHDSNIFRVPEAKGPQSDSITTGALLAGLNQPISRQRVYADLELRRQRFDKLQELNNTGYKLASGLDWETVGNFSGALKLGTEKSLASYSTLFQETLQEKNIERERSFSASVQRGTARNDLQVFGALNAREVDYSSPAFRSRENNRRALRIGARWHKSDLLTLGAAAVEARGKYPSLPDAYNSHGVEFTGDWAVSGASHLDGKIIHERRRYDSARQRDFSGLTGLLRWKWEPTGKLALTTSLLRDADDSERFTDNTPNQPIAGSRVTNSVMLDGAWKATSKITFNASMRYSDRKLVNFAPSGAPMQRGSDTTRLASLGATWTATNNVSVGCNVARESRSTESNLSFSYKANTANCYLQAALK
ncbi:outer membrane beta-barrel protein [Azohydromonas sp. G-1-1-14]|uniref:Outer membrane beta-barrel protein n=2 Tax=Azohydromonas caseinilytica TaxID=2728836 RepID=A0A848F562_9BURK|nr:outer membrane beta-barrel protein [Azohydromonas caseinilytica]